MATIARLSRTTLRLNNVVFRGNIIRIAGISTSKKKKDTVALTDTVLERVKTKDDTTDQTEKNWISWGFNTKNETDDNTQMHISFFLAFTLCIVTTGFVWAYYPDFKMFDWAQREGYLELRRREELGLPLIDPNLVDVEKMELPEDEELGDTEIII